MAILALRINSSSGSDLRWIKSLHPQSFLFVILLAVAIIFTAYTAINNIVTEQSRIQQQAISPVFSLVNEELLTPLNIAKTLGKTEYFNDLMDTAEIDEKALVAQLNKLEKNLNLTFFVASEKARKQYLSNGRVIELIEGKVFWYFEALAQNKDLFADLGQVGDVHLYFDIKIYNENKENLGFVGVGKPLKAFLETFEEYKQLYGYDFLFVDDTNQILLTSFADLVVKDEHIPRLEEQSWFPQSKGQVSFDNLLITVGQEEYLISEISIDELDWKLLLLVPMHARQAKITKTFIANIGMAVSLVLLLFIAVFYLLLIYKRRLEKNSELDPLSGLPNRTFIQKQFYKLRRQNANLCLVMIDLDHFKRINDTYGHNAGDTAIQQTANVLSSELREKDILGRWGGEEFVMLLPTSNEEMGMTIAQRACEKLANYDLEYENNKLSVTASFGVTYGKSSEQFSKLLANADMALYEAKSKGRNRVETYRGDTSDH